MAALAIVLGALTWTALCAPSATAAPPSTTCTFSGTTASVVLDQPAGTPTSLSQDGSNNLLVDGFACGNFGGMHPLSGIQLTVASAALAQTLLVDQTGAGGIFPCSAPIGGTLRASDAIQIKGANGESLSAGDTPGGSGVDLNSCSSVGTIVGVGDYELIAGAAAVTLSAGAGSPFSGALSVPATFQPSPAASDTLIGGATGDAIDFSAVATSPSAPLTINLSGAPESVSSVVVENDTAVVGSVTYTFTSGGAEFTTFDGATTGYTDFLAGSSSDTFAAANSSDAIDFSSVQSSQSAPLTVNMSGATSDGVANDTAQTGTTTDKFTTGSASVTFIASAAGYTTFLPGSTSETFAGLNSATDALDFSGVPTTMNSPLTVNRSSQPDGAQPNTATAGTATYTFSGSWPLGTFGAAATGFTRFVAGNTPDKFTAPVGSATDTLDFSVATGSTLTINLSGASSNGVANDTAQLGTVTEMISPNITTYDGLSGGNTTFLAAPTGGYDFNGNNTGNTLDLQAVPAGARVTANGDSTANPGTVQSLSTGPGGSTVDTFAAIQLYVGVPASPTTAVDDVATGAAWTGTEVAGAAAYDTATVSPVGNVTPTGTVTYSLFADGNCAGTATSPQHVTLSAGSVPKSPSTGPLAAGVYGFRADYSGDGTFRPSTGSCERFVIPGPPSAMITVPVANHTYALGQVIATSFSCTEGPNGPGVRTCSDGNGGTGTTGKLDTSTVGSHDYTVTATSDDGQRETATVRYLVAAPPSVKITSPHNGAVYRKGQRIRASYTCAEGAGGSGINKAGCVGPVPSGAAIATSAPGMHSFTVHATSTDGLTRSLTVDYRVLRPSATIVIKTSAATVNARHAFTVALSCSSGAGDCAGSLTLRTAQRKIAFARFALVAGQVANVKMMLTEAGRRLLASAGHHRLRAAAVAITRTNTTRRWITLADQR